MRALNWVGEMALMKGLEKAGVLLVISMG